MTTIADLIKPGLEARLRTLAEPERCGATGKVIFSSKPQAKAELRRALRRGSGERAIHFCSFGDHWHLASHCDWARRK